jgi:hypothetical protein
LASDLLKDKVFQSVDHLWMILYLIAEDIQEKHEIYISSELDSYRSLVFTKPFHFHIRETNQKVERLLSLWRESFSLHNKSNHESSHLENEEEKEKDSKAELENISQLDSTEKDYFSNPSEIGIICDSDCYLNGSDYSDSDSSEIGDYTEMHSTTFNENSKHIDCEKKSYSNSSDDLEIIFE